VSFFFFFLLRLPHGGVFRGYGYARQNSNGSRDLTTPLSGMPYQFTIHGLAIATGNLPTKSEMSISTHYEDMKDDTKCPKMGWFGVVSVTQGHWK